MRAAQVSKADLKRAFELFDQIERERAVTYDLAGDGVIVMPDDFFEFWIHRAQEFWLPFREIPVISGDETPPQLRQKSSIE